MPRSALCALLLSLLIGCGDSASGGPSSSGAGGGGGDPILSVGGGPEGGSGPAVGPDWVARFGDEELQQADMLAVSDQRLVIAGIDDGAIDFGLGALPDAGMAVQGFVAELDLEGAPTWSIRVGADKWLRQRAALHSADGVYVAGGFGAELRIGDETHVGKGPSEAFLARLDHEGNLVWSSVFGGAGYDEIFEVASVPEGGVVIAGELGSPDASIGGLSGRFMAHVAADGTVLWARGAPEVGFFTSLAVAADGTFVSAGIFDGETSCGNAQLTPYDGVGGMHDIYLARHDALGEVMWCHRLGGPGDDLLRPVKLGPDGNVFLVGYYDGAFAAFGVELEEATTGYRGFVTKISPDGQAMWAQPMGVENAAPAGVAPTPDGGAVVTGLGHEDTGIGAEPTVVRSFMTRLTADGVPVWSWIANGALGIRAYLPAIAVVGDHVFAAGDLTGDVLFGDTPLASAGMSDVLVTRFSAAAPPMIE